MGKICFEYRAKEPRGGNTEWPKLAPKVQMQKQNIKALARAINAAFDRTEAESPGGFHSPAALIQISDQEAIP